MTATRGNHAATTAARLASFGLEDGPLARRWPPSAIRCPRPCTCSRTLDEVRTATETVAASGQRLISIMTPDLEPDIYDQAAILDIIKRFVLGHSFAKVRVLMRDQARLVSGANRFIAMAHRLTSYLEIRVRAAAVPASSPPPTASPMTARSSIACAPIAPRASPDSTIRRSRASTCRNSTPSGRRAAPRSARCASPGAEPHSRADAVRGAAALSFRMVWKPDVTVAALVERDGRFLLVEERIRGRVVFNQPAGGHPNSPIRGEVKFPH